LRRTRAGYTSRASISVTRCPGYGPTVLFLNPDHTFRCQKALQFNVDASRGVPRSGAYSIALTDDSVIVAGVYGDWGGFWHVARLFIAVFNKGDCSRTGIKELIDGSLRKWVNLYPFFVSGVKVVWDQDRSSMFVMLQTLEATILFRAPSLHNPARHRAEDS
jgi:hypothetical protein